MTRLTQAREQHESLADAARQARAQDADGDQSDVAAVLKSQNEDIAGLAQGASQQGGFPELSAPHLVLASPAGIEASTPGSTHVASGEHIALTSAGHTSLSAGASLLASVKGAIRLFAYKAGMRLVAAQGDIDIQALEKNLKLLAKLDITLTANRIEITAKEEVIVNGGGSFTHWKAQGITHGTKGAWIEHAATHSLIGPRSLPLPEFKFPEAVCKECLRKALAAASPLGRR